MSRSQVKRCVMHVGQPKTGTSYLQSSLALSDARLREQGIYYPPYGAAQQRQGSGRIGSGNGHPLYFGERSKLEEQLSARVAEASEQGLDQLLFSSEWLFALVYEDPAVVGRITGALAAAAGRDVKLCFVLYIRNPFEHAVSLYQQMVKRNGFTGTFDGMLANSDLDGIARHAYLDNVAGFLDAAATGGADVTVFNYSYVRDALVATLEDALGIERESLATPPVDIINRSLSAFELEVQRLFNQHCEVPSSGFVSDVLVEQLPLVQANTPPCSPAVVQDFLDRVNPQAEQLNLRLPSDHRYALQTADDVGAASPADAASREYVATRSQLEVLIASVARAVAKAQESGGS